jgi:hypothetical protein
MEQQSKHKSMKFSFKYTFIYKKTQKLLDWLNMAQYVYFCNKFWWNLQIFNFTLAFKRSQLSVEQAVWAGAPSCWKNTIFMQKLDILICIKYSSNKR